MCINPNVKGWRILKNNFQKILSMDLSLNLPAFCVAEINDGKFTIIELSHVDNKKKTKFTTAQKLQEIANEIRRLIDKHGPFDVIVREKGFSRFANTTQLLFRVVGISDLIAIENGDCVAIEELPPATVKVAVAGYSRASKEEVEEGVRELLPEHQKEMEFYSDDESDAVAVGLTYCLRKGLLN